MIFCNFFGIFFNPPKHPNFLNYRLTFFSRNWPWKLGYEHAHKPNTYSLRPFSILGACPLRQCIDSDPPAFLGLIVLFQWILFVYIDNFRDSICFNTSQIQVLFLKTNSRLAKIKSSQNSNSKNLKTSRISQICQIKINVLDLDSRFFSLNLTDCIAKICYL